MFERYHGSHNADDVASMTARLDKVGLIEPKAPLSSFSRDPGLPWRSCWAEASLPVSHSTIRRNDLETYIQFRASIDSAFMFL